MKKVLRKSDAEKKEDASKIMGSVAVKDTIYFYWVCDDCSVAFFGDDKILKCADEVIRCPLTRGFFKKQCLSHLHGGDEKCFNRYYKLP